MSTPGTLIYKPKIPWRVEVVRIARNSYRATFVCGVQSFDIRRIEDDPEAKTLCEFFGRMFEKAMENLGAPPPKRKRQLKRKAP